VFEPAVRIVGHPFSDAEELGEVRLPCYSLDEIMAEKVRAVLGQRVYAISRDIYDIHSLMEDVDDRKILAGLPEKMAARDADGFLFYVMPFVEGESLRDRLDEERQLPIDEAIGRASCPCAFLVRRGGTSTPARLERVRSEPVSAALASPT